MNETNPMPLGAKDPAVVVLQMGAMGERNCLGRMELRVWNRNRDSAARLAAPGAQW